ncbi:hypothetical protein BJY52DRAFT_154419 [Lactarius psammicola]|nr:hypothetical protein BJY52DRAFT_154419 [Lactarius psammicola]
MLVGLFGRIESFFEHLRIYTEVSPPPTVRNILARNMADVLQILAVATKGMKEKRPEVFLKKLAGMNDIEDASRRLRQLEKGELLTVITQVLRETKDDAKQTNGMAKKTVNIMDAHNSDEVLPPDEPSAPASEPPRPNAWRSVHQRGGFRRTRKKSEARQASASDSWQVQPGPEYTLPSSEPMTHLAPEVPLQPHGLFGPRSPRSSIEEISVEEPAPEPSRPRKWQSIHQRRVFRRTRKKSETHPSEGIIEAPTHPPPAQPPGRVRRRVVSASSWGTWQPQPGLEYTPPPSEPRLAPEFPPGLFGPRSPRSSM